MDPAAAGRAGRRRGRSRRIKGTAHVSWRDTMCGVLRAGDAGRRVTLAGWVDARRDHGGLVFIDLRDHTGLVQLVVRPENDPVAHDVRNEFVLQAEGEIVARAPDAVNPNIPTGEVEIQVDTLRIVSTSEPLPFQIGDESVDEVLRLRYRYLDMRGDRMQRNLRLNHVIINAIRRTMDDLAFVDVWTPSMTKGTPEGARDFLVPVRLQPGKFYALAQSPQLFKQLCMVGGLDRSYQIATCWRDEDLRADRQFEFRQLDLEMSFVERAVRHRQARPSLRSRDRGRDRSHARLAVRRVRERSVRPLHRRSPHVLAQRACAARRDREGVGGEGTRPARADLEVPFRRRTVGIWRPGRLDGALRRRRGVRGRSGLRAQPALRPHLERLGARLRLDPDPRRRDAAGCLPRDGHGRERTAGEVRLPPRSLEARRAAARRLRDGHRPFRRPHGG